MTGAVAAVVELKIQSDYFSIAQKRLLYIDESVRMTLRFKEFI